MEEEENQTKRESTFPLFSKYFAVHPQNVVDYMGTMKKQMQDFIDAFRKRIDIEINYSKSLTQVSKALDKYIKPGTEYSTSFISSAFKVEHEQRSRQALELAEALKTEVESMCSEMLRKEVNFYKKMEKDVKRYYKEAANLEQNHKEALSRFQGISREMEEMIITKNIMKYTTGIPQDKKVKLISKTMDSIRENKEYEKLYLLSVKNYNYFVNAYNEEVKGQLDQAETQIRDQVTMQCDCLRKLIVAEVSMFKNIQYDLLNISKQMEYLDNQKEVEIFVEEYKHSTTNRIITDDEEAKRNASFNEAGFGDCVLQPKRIVGKSMLSNSLLHVDEEYFSWMLFNKKNKKLRDMVAGIWKQLKEQMEPSKLQVSPKQQEDQVEGNGNQLPETEVSKEEKVIESNQNQEKQESGPGEEPKVQKKQSEGAKQTELSKQSGIEQQVKETPVSEAAHDWPKQLRQFVLSMKVQRPPSLLSTQNIRKQKTPNEEILFESLMQIMRIISSLWNVGDLEPLEADKLLMGLERLMAEQHLYRLIALLFLEEYRIQLQVMLKDADCARICSRVLKVIIRESQKENDTFIIRGILGLIFTYYWIDDKYKRLLYLNPEVYQCDIWKKHDFWEAAIFETTYEEMAMFSKQKGETGAETILRQKNIIFSQLASFCHYMVMLGISSKNVRQIVGRYCRLYDMTEEQNKDLSKMITNTVKQFKEVSFQFNLRGSEREKSVINE